MLLFINLIKNDQPIPEDMKYDLFPTLQEEYELSYAGKMDLTTSILVAGFANVLGSSFLFYMGRYNKNALMPYIKAHRRKLALSHILMKKYGDKIIFIQLKENRRSRENPEFCVNVL